METHRADDTDVLEPDGLSRREVLRRIGAGGLGGGCGAGRFSFLVPDLCCRAGRLSAQA